MQSIYITYIHISRLLLDDLTRHQPTSTKFVLLLFYHPYLSHDHLANAICSPQSLQPLKNRWRWTMQFSFWDSAYFQVRKCEFFREGIFWPSWNVSGSVNLGKKMCPMAALWSPSYFCAIEPSYISCMQSASVFFRTWDDSLLGIIPWNARCTFYPCIKKEISDIGYQISRSHKHHLPTQTPHCKEEIPEKLPSICILNYITQ